MKKLWKKYRAALLAIVSGVIGFDIGEAWQQAQDAGEPAPAVAAEQSITTTPAQEKEADGDGADACSVSSAPDASAHADVVDFSSLDWCWGGFKGGSAKPADGVEIANLKVSASGMGYKWVKGGCEQLGASGKTDASCLACLFVKRGGDWVGGKFDWISTSRLTRGFENIRDGYNGWPKDAVSSANEFVFVILSKDGKKRTNVAYFKR